MTRCSVTTFLVCCVFCGLGTLQAEESPLTLKSREALKAPSPLSGTVYLHPQGLELLAAGGYSPDNGKTWESRPTLPDFDSKLPAGYRRELFRPFADPVNGHLLVIVNSMDTPGLDPAAIEPEISLKTYYLRYRVSVDGGKTYLFDEPIVQQGAEYSEKHPFEGVTVGQNAIFLGDAGSQSIRIRDGKILVLAQVCTVNDKGELYSPGGGFTYTDVLVLIGTWQKDHRLTWEVSERVQADPARSTRGMIEPTIAELPDGTLLMVMRGSNGGPKDPEYKLPGYRWVSLSKDGGKTWTKPEPWTWSDGKRFYSPSSMSQLVPHSSGRLFWIGNICQVNPQGNDPRSPLLIVEVDIASRTLICESVLEIDRLREEDTEGVELSAHAAANEDRESGDQVLAMQRFTRGYKSSTPYLYRIGVTKK